MWIRNYAKSFACISRIQDTPQSINTIIGNGKRFMSYEIVKRLEKLNRLDLLNQLGSLVNKMDKSRGKLHEVFEPSFD